MTPDEIRTLLSRFTSRLADITPQITASEMHEADMLRADIRKLKAALAEAGG